MGVAWEAGGEGDGFTFPAATPQRRIDYVFVTRGITVDRAWVPETEASDHRPVVAELRRGLSSSCQITHGPRARK